MVLSTKNFDLTKEHITLTFDMATWKVFYEGIDILYYNRYHERYMTPSNASYAAWKYITSIQEAIDRVNND